MQFLFSHFSALYCCISLTWHANHIWDWTVPIDGGWCGSGHYWGVFRAVSMWMSSFYIFNLAYPRSLVKALLFCQKIILNIKDNTPNQEQWWHLSTNYIRLTWLDRCFYLSWQSCYFFIALVHVRPKVMIKMVFKCYFV